MSERIVGVAVRLPFREIPDAQPTFAAAPAPARHHHILLQLWPLREPGTRIDQGQGFVTDAGRYVDREKAWEIAKAAGQLLERAPTDGRGGTLYSEDVW
jgi:hypothetical protein